MKALKAILNRTSAWLAARADTGQVRRTATGSRAKAVRWMLWNTRNARRTLIVGGLVLFLAMLTFLRLTAYRNEVAQYEAGLAAKAAAATQAATPAPAAVTITPESPFTANPHTLEGTDHIAAPGAKPQPEPKTTPAPPKVSVTGTPQVVTAVPAAEKVTQGVAGKFLNVWSAAVTYRTTGAWLDAMAPYATDDMLQLFRLTDVTQVPQAKVKSMTSVTSGDTAHVDARMSDGSTLSVVLEDMQGTWKVIDLDLAAAR